MIPEEIFPVMEPQLCEQSMILTLICSLLKHWPHPVLSLSSLLRHLRPSYIPHYKNESKRKLALQQQGTIHVDK